MYLLKWEEKEDTIDYYPKYAMAHIKEVNIISRKDIERIVRNYDAITDFTKPNDVMLNPINLFYL